MPYPARREAPQQTRLLRMEFDGGSGDDGGGGEASVCSSLSPRHYVALRSGLTTVGGGGG